MEPRSPSLQTDSLPVEPQEEPKNTGVGSLSLLQQIFLIQELNWGLLHCRQILYQLIFQGHLGKVQMSGHGLQVPSQPGLSWSVVPSDISFPAPLKTQALSEIHALKHGFCLPGKLRYSLP